MLSACVSHSKVGRGELSTAGVDGTSHPASLPPPRQPRTLNSGVSA